MITWDRVEQLRAEIGEDAFQEVVALFLEEVDEVIARMRASPDRATFRNDLHFLKGSALNLGFRTFAALCQQGEYSEPGDGNVTPEKIFAEYAASRASFLSGLTERAWQKAG